MQPSFPSESHVLTKISRPVRPPIKCLFVGNDFFRKGGIPVLQAFEQANTLGFPLSLTIVSTLSPKDYVTNAGHGEVDRVRQFISKLPNVKLLSNVPNAEVLDLMHTSDLFLFPTLDDTFGYVVLESISRATPVISTDVRALPETNSSETGWLVDIPKAESMNEQWSGMAHPRDSLQRQQMLKHVYRIIQDRLVSIFAEILENPDVLRTKGMAAYRFALSRFSPVRHAEQMSQIYTAALS